LDGVRRLTNFSTGELGLLLSAELSRAGHGVICMKGEGAMAHTDAGGARVIRFSTNADLMERLREFSGDSADAVFHAAALCDYRVKSVRGGDGAILKAEKLPSRAGELTLTLEPALKLLPKLRAIFPNAQIVGWKYELDGTPGDVLAKAREQLTVCRTDACVVNGTAWGKGFGFVEPGRDAVNVHDKFALCKFIAKWLGEGK
jgi:phosphopantothenoylcysteine decarboxylase/phosphopantothenate--cysteine ligase